MLQTVTENIKQGIHNDPMLSSLSTLARKRRIPLFLVGGYLRDLFLGTRRKDYDFALPKDASSAIVLFEEALGLHFFKVGKELKEMVNTGGA